MTATIAHPMTAHYAAATAKADELLIAMVDATTDVWDALTCGGVVDTNAAMFHYANAASARQDIEAIGYTTDHHAGPSNPDMYRAALANLMTADRAITDALDAIAA